jgi:hypothetical protein
MQFFNVGVLELLFILVLAFVVLGPSRSVKMARNIGVWIRNFVKSPFWRDIITTSNEIRDLPNRIMDDAELQQMITELDLSSQDIKDILSQTQSETRTELQEVEEQINQDLQSDPSSREKTSDEI